MLRTWIFAGIFLAAGIVLLVVPIHMQMTGVVLCMLGRSNHAVRTAASAKRKKDAGLSADPHDYGGVGSCNSDDVYEYYYYQRPLRLEPGGAVGLCCSAGSGSKE